MSNTAVILAAGNGTRMKTKDSKLLLKINGKTVLDRSVNAFLNISDVDEVIVVAREKDIPAFSDILTDERVSFVVGGDTRQQSVMNALDVIDDCELIIIHDGARPLIKSVDIENTIRAAKENKAAAVGVFVKDTVKVVDKNGFVVSTPDRSTLFAVQTPQIFDFELYRKAAQNAREKGLDFTDDCQLVESFNQKVKTVVGSYSNIKITTPDDIVLAENLLKNEALI
ncbi:2-C-methyl-D-erythritol 4-phosphate cytidylyltransferase [Eubacterium sp.]|uniref:2-C-methyl-D-erythritol 4-phosphate cytidylyltransferase n=1 Tax=Eubacterium sp. TaxID=142586 RepID=UPI001EB50DAA|nr:2-C-methyl-D-erythritol 4-phosphate cytidylyltransferase [Eubacterium sp.]MBS5275971.1 2-C-methyl-D-erythritol 4-phosphate cytidylyltransferase [Clostridiales bacterium]